MARIAGLEIPRNKRVEIALGYVYGVGRPLAKKILQETGIQEGVRVKDLSDLEVNKINSYLTQNVKVEGDLRREVQQNIRRLIEIGSYKGMRHRRNLPVRGQRTKTNARTRRGKRKTVGAARAVEKAAPAAAK